MAFITSMQESYVKHLEKREAKPRLHTFSHASELARMCPFKCAMNQIRGESPRDFDLKQSARVAFGEEAEDLNLKLTLKHSKAERGLWPRGGLKVATIGKKKLVDRHSSTKSPTFLYDKEFNTGGRADAFLQDKDSGLWVLESKTVAKEVGLDLFELWQNPEVNQDPVDWLSINPKYYWIRPWPRQTMLYYWLGSRVYDNLRGAIITIRPLGMMPFFIHLDPLQYTEIIKQMLDRAYRIKETVNEADPDRQAEKLKELYRVSGPDCSRCPWHNECGVLRAEDKEIHGGVETVNDTVLLSHLRQKEDSRAGNLSYGNHHDEARNLGMGYLACPEPGQSAERKLIVGEYLVTVSWTWTEDQIDKKKLVKLPEEIKSELREHGALRGKHKPKFTAEPLYEEKESAEEKEAVHA